jgi:hypothetical protein
MAPRKEHGETPAEDPTGEVRQAAPAGEPERPETILSDPSWGAPEPDPDQVISLHTLLLAEFYGDTPEPVSWAAVARFEDFCRHHNIGGTNRNSEGFYGAKTKDLVRTADKELTGRDNPLGRFDWTLLAAMRSLGAEVTP